MQTANPDFVKFIRKRLLLRILPSSWLETLTLLSLVGAVTVIPLSRSLFLDLLTIIGNIIAYVLAHYPNLLEPQDKTLRKNVNNVIQLVVSIGAIVVFSVWLFSQLDFPLVLASYLFASLLFRGTNPLLSLVHLTSQVYIVYSSLHFLSGNYNIFLLVNCLFMLLLLKHYGLGFCKSSRIVAGAFVAFIMVGVVAVYAQNLEPPLNQLVKVGVTLQVACAFRKMLEPILVSRSWLYPTPR